MADLEQRRYAGLDAVHRAAELLQRIQHAHPIGALYQAAEMEWWWTMPRNSDRLEQLFWTDDETRPIAAALLTDFGGGESQVYGNVIFCPFVMPDADPGMLELVVSAGLAHAYDHGIDHVELEVDETDDVLHAILRDRGFAVAQHDAMVAAWLTIENRPAVSELADGYRLTNRDERRDVAHHMAIRNPLFATERLSDLSLYRPALDLVVVRDADTDADRDEAGSTSAAYGLFWFDPVTRTGVVEPMRTMDEHQRRGLARHVLTAGVNALFDAGAQRVSIGWAPENPASGQLYRDVGFEPVSRSDMWSGPTAR